MLPIDMICDECDIDMDAVDTDPDNWENSVIFECPECGYMIEFYEEEGETYANEIW